MVVGLFCGVLWVCFMVAMGLFVVAVLFWWCYVGVGLCFFFFFFFVQLLGFVVVAGGPTVGWVSVAPLECVLGQWVAAWVFLFFFFFFGVDSRLWVGGGGGGGGVRCV